MPASQTSVSKKIVRWGSVIALGFLMSSSFAQETKNSMSKKRVQPNAQAAKIGSAVNWQPDFAAAMAKSKETGKPIFWYVPTLPGTFMDRKMELHRYMLAGPFSWPDITSVINEHYVPVKRPPTRELQTRYELQPYKFVEPGFVIIKPDGTVQKKIDRLSTIHPKWFRSLLTASVDQPIPVAKKPESLAKAWDRFKVRDFAGTLKQLNESSDTLGKESDAAQCESKLLAGMATFRMGKHAEAKSIWKQAGETFGNEPLGWKSAAEAQGIGPFYRGLEIHGALTEQAMKSGFDSVGSAAPANTYDEKQVWKKGVDYILGMQNENGSFVDSDYDFGGFDSMPNVYVAVSSLAGMALLESANRDSLSDSAKSKLADSITRTIKYVIDDSNINPVDRDEILWAYAYRTRFLSRCIAQTKIKLGISTDELKSALATSARKLEGVQGKRGGWYHEYNNPFVTATALSALHEAKQAGATIDQSKITRGLESLAGDRFENGAFPYDSSRRRGPADRAKGTDRNIAASAGRMPICEMGLWYWGKSSDELLSTAVERSLALHKNLNVALKYDNHTSTMAYGGFFFWYDMRSRSEAIGNIKDESVKAKYKAQQKAIVMSLPEIDGCFIDSHELGRVYGTSMALLSLSKCE
ncbi:MAG: hypothetical protein AB8B55_04255 [Mariniblastus sp.]